MAKFLFKLLFIRIKVEGMENVDKSQIYILMGNHVSMFDIPLVFGYMPVPFIGLEASEHFKTPIYGLALRRYGNIPIDRKSSRSSLQSILKGVDVVKNGSSVLILPEGTRTITPEMGEFKKFPFLLAQKAEKDILPFGFSGLWKINNKNSWLISPGKVTIKFGEPIPAEVVTSYEINDLITIVRGKIESLIYEP